MRFVLLGAASFVMLIGLVAAWNDYMAAFQLELNYFHALRGLAWNVGAYTLARTLVWWAMATDLDGAKPNPQLPDSTDGTRLSHLRTEPKSSKTTHESDLAESDPEAGATKPSPNAPEMHPRP